MHKRVCSSNLLQAKAFFIKQNGLKMIHLHKGSYNGFEANRDPIRLNTG